MPWSKSPPFQYVTATPLTATPLDGAEMYYRADASTGVTWHLRYNATSGSAYKWEYVGGGYLSGSATGTTGTSNNAYVTLDPCKVTVPLAGDYDIEGETSLLYTGASTSWIGVATSTSGAPVAETVGLSSAGAWTPYHISARLTAVPANSDLTLRYKSFSSNTINGQNNARIFARPVRVSF